MTKIIYLGLGSNMGERAAQLREAIGRLPGIGVEPLRESAMLETAPMYVADQPMFLNMVVEAETELLPRVLLKRLLGIEQEMGRKRVVAKGPRLIDIDLLFYGRFVIDAPELKVPHPGIEERHFVLKPLVELAPDFRHPVSGKTMRELWEALKPTSSAS